MACLLGSIVAAWDGLGTHFGGLGDILGRAGVPDWPGHPRIGWIAFRLRREHCFTGIQGSRAPPKLGVIWFFWALLSTNQCLIR